MTPATLASLYEGMFCFSVPIYFSKAHFFHAADLKRSIIAVWLRLPIKRSRKCKTMDEHTPVQQNGAKMETVTPKNGRNGMKHNRYCTYNTDQRKGKHLLRPTRRTPAVSMLIARGSVKTFRGRIMARPRWPRPILVQGWWTTLQL